MTPGRPAWDDSYITPPDSKCQYPILFFFGKIFHWNLLWIFVNDAIMTLFRFQKEWFTYVYSFGRRTFSYHRSGSRGGSFHRCLGCCCGSGYGGGVDTARFVSLLPARYPTFVTISSFPIILFDSAVNGKIRFILLSITVRASMSPTVILPYLVSFSAKR